jgi:ribonuclease-3
VKKKTAQSEKPAVSPAMRGILRDIVKKAEDAEKAALRARAILLSATGKPDAVTAKRLGVSAVSVKRWLSLYKKGSLGGVLSGKVCKEGGAALAVGPEEEATISEVEAMLGYRFLNRALLSQALMHRSAINERCLPRAASNERLEFLGDAVLGLVLSSELSTVWPDENEGGLSRLRAALVNEHRLSDIAAKLGVGPYLNLGRGEEMSGGREKSSILSDAYEAIIAAVFLDGGFEAARRLVLAHFEPVLGKAERLARDVDSKSRLQEIAQVAFKTAPVYAVVGESGPDHEKVFEVEVRLRGEPLGRGSGRSKREAEQRAARDAEGPLREKINALNGEAAGASAGRA